MKTPTSFPPCSNASGIIVSASVSGDGRERRGQSRIELRLLGRDLSDERIVQRVASAAFWKPAVRPSATARAAPSQLTAQARLWVTGSG